MKKAGRAGAGGKSDTHYVQLGGPLLMVYSTKNCKTRREEMRSGLVWSK